MAITASPTAQNDNSYYYKYTSNATNDTFTIPCVGVFDTVTISAVGISADTLVFSTSPDGTAIFPILDDFGANPFAAPAKNKQQIVSPFNSRFLGMVRTGEADGAIAVHITFSRKV